MNNLIIRLYREGDFAQLCTIFLRAVRETACRDYDAEQVAAWATIDEAAWHQRFSRSRIWVAQCGQEVVGFITVAGSEIDLLFVRPDYQRRGIASALLSRLEQSMPAALFTVYASITALPFFTLHGYEIVREQQVSVRGATFTRYAMRKEMNR